MTTKAIVGGRVIDGAGTDPTKPGVVVVCDDRIHCVGGPDAAEIPADAEVIDAGEDGHAGPH